MQIDPVALGISFTRETRPTQKIFKDWLEALKTETA